MNTLKTLTIILYVLCLSSFTFIDSKKENSTINNIVSNDSMAIKIAIDTWLPLNGNHIYEKQPFVTKLIGDTCWEVKGSLNMHISRGDTIWFDKGGVPHIIIRKKDAKILSVYHTK